MVPVARISACPCFDVDQRGLPIRYLALVGGARQRRFSRMGAGFPNVILAGRAAFEMHAY